MRVISLVLVSLFFASSVFAQDTAPNYLLYRYNMNILNPAYAGVSEKTTINVGFRKQQLGFDSNSGTQYISFSKGFKRNIGFGVSILNTRLNITKKTTSTAEVSYKVQLDQATYLYFGIKAGGAFYGIDYTSLGVNDPLFSANVSTFSPIIGIGAYLKGERYFVNISSPNLVLSAIEKPKTDNIGNDVSEKVRDRLHIYIGGGYRFSLTENIDLKPSVFSSIVSDKEMLLDISTIADFSNKIELGLTYRVNNSFVGSFLLKVLKKTSFGYAYEATTSNYSALSSGTHEFLVRFYW